MDYKNDTYEEQVASYKQRLFERLHALTPSLNAVVVELGIGCFPNAIYYTGWTCRCSASSWTPRSTPRPCPALLSTDSASRAARSISMLCRQTARTLS